MGISGKGLIKYSSDQFYICDSEPDKTKWKSFAVQPWIVMRASINYYKQKTPLLTLLVNIDFTLLFRPFI